MPKKHINMFDLTKNDLQIIENCDTISGALNHLPNLFDKIKSDSKANIEFYKLEKQLENENQLAFESLLRTVEWIHEKIKELIPFIEDNSYDLQHLHSLLNYQILNLSSGGHLQNLIFELRSITSKIVQDKNSHPILKQWTKISQLPPQKYEIKNPHENPITNDDIIIKEKREFFVSEFIFPNYVENEINNLNKLSFKDSLYHWKEKIDVSFFELYKFLKILSQYDSFIPLEINPLTWISPKSLQELEGKQYQAYVGFYLSLFKSSDKTIHPLSNGDLLKLLKRFIAMLNKEISNPKLKGPQLQKFLSEEAEKYCINLLVNYISKLSPEELEEFKKSRYEYEVFEFLNQNANKTNQVFKEKITKTMIKERVGPKANQQLLRDFNIIWNPIYQK